MVIKDILNEYKNPVKNIITIKDNLVCVGIYKIPTYAWNQNLQPPSRDPQKNAYPDYAKTMLSLFADLISCKLGSTSERNS